MTKHMTHSSAPSRDIFNLGSSYFHVPVTTVRHLLIVVGPTMSCFVDWSKRRHVTLSIIE